MMKKLATYLFMLTLFVACGGGGDAGGGQYGGSEYLNINNNSSTLDIPSDNTTATLVINASPGCEWKITWDESSGWIKSVSPSSGRGSQNVTIMISTNNTMKERSSILSVNQTNGNIPTRSVTLKQMAGSENLSLSLESISFVNTGGEQKVSVTSNSQWRVEGAPEWLTVNPTSGENDGVFSVKAGPNATSSEQTAVLTIRSAGGITKNISVKQAAAALPTIYTPQVSNKGKNQATISFSFDSELPVTSYGICYSATSEAPDLDHDTHVTRTGSESHGSPSIELTELASGTTYHVRAYAVSIVGTQYSSAITFATESNWPENGDNPTPNN